jgi:hypothetical protein
MGGQTGSWKMSAVLKQMDGKKDGKQERLAVRFVGGGGLTERQLSARIRQIEIGQETKEYRLLGKPPKGPSPYTKCSKRSFEGMVRAWRRQLHALASAQLQSNPHTNTPRNWKPPTSSLQTISP